MSSLNRKIMENGSVVLIVSLLSLWVGSTSCKGSDVTNKAALFVFGDSLFDVGNNNHINTARSLQANFWPYGETTFKSPTGRFSDGRVIPDFIAEYAWLPLIPPYLQPSNNYVQYTYGVNFASGGAGALVGTFPGLVIDLQTQLRNFKNVEKNLKGKLGDAEAKQIISRAVYIFHIGANDYFFPFSNSTGTSVFRSSSDQQYVDTVIGNTTVVVKEIYKAGGRKFGFMNLAPFDRIPAALITDPKNIGTPFKPVSRLIRLHNKAFPNVLKDLAAELMGFKYSFFDLHTLMVQVMDNPSKHGFKEATKACCGSGPLRGINTCGHRMGTSSSSGEYELCENVEDYIFFDASHPTEKASELAAKHMWNGPPTLVGSVSLKTLFQLS